MATDLCSQCGPGHTSDGVVCDRHGKRISLVRCTRCRAWVNLTFGKDSPAEHAYAAGTQLDPRAPGDHDDLCDVCEWNRQ